jgi:hypothetical protein
MFQERHKTAIAIVFVGLNSELEGEEALGMSFTGFQARECADACFRSTLRPWYVHVREEQK